MEVSPCGEFENSWTGIHHTENISHFAKVENIIIDFVKRIETFRENIWYDCLKN